MSKPREPVSFEDAVGQAIGALGRDACAEAIGRTAAQVYAAADPDKPSMLRVDHMLRLDLAMLSATGRAPGFEVYAARIRAAQPLVANGVTLQQRAATIAKESGEAVAALLCPDAELSPAQLDGMSRELHEAIASMTAAARDIDARRGAQPGKRQSSRGGGG